MTNKSFKKEDFVKNRDNDRYRIEFDANEIGEGVDLIIERKKENGDYEIIQAEISRLNDKVFISWSEPFDGRIVSDEYKHL